MDVFQCMVESFIGPCIFTIVNMKQRHTTLTLSYATSAHALCVSGCISSMNLHGIQIITFNSSLGTKNAVPKLSWLVIIQQS